MIKGIPTGAVSSDYTNIPLPDFDDSFPQAQDTIKSTSSVLQTTRPKIVDLDTSSSGRERVEQLFKAAEAREKTIARPKAKTIEIFEDTTGFVGSTTRIDNTSPLLSLTKDYTYNPNENILFNILKKNGKTDMTNAVVPDSAKSKTTTVSTTQPFKSKEITGFEGNARVADSNGWYIFVLLIALSIFAWGKALYQKYLLQILASVYNYQISIQLFRDKNALFRNLSIILQFLFPINIGLLIYLLIDYYSFNQVFQWPLASIAVYSASVFVFFRLKTLLYKFLGVIFKVEEDFHEIQHHMNTFNQTTGVILLPFIISIPFLNEEFKPVLIISLFLFIGIIGMLFLYRGFQIVIRKQVSIFFLILYLCAVEILPVVLLIKTSYTII